MEAPTLHAVMVLFCDGKNQNDSKTKHGGRLFIVMSGADEASLALISDLLWLNVIYF